MQCCKKDLQLGCMGMKRWITRRPELILKLVTSQ